MFNLRVVKGFVDGINRAAGHTGFTKYFDPLITGFGYSDFVDEVIQLIAVFRTQYSIFEIRVILPFFLV